MSALLHAAARASPHFAPTGLAARWRREALVVALLPLAVAAALHAAGEASLLWTLRGWLTLSSWHDSWEPMARALAVLQQPGGRAFHALFFGEGVKFQYPPSSLLPHAFAARAGIPFTQAGLNFANWVLVWTEAALCAALGWRLAGGLRGASSGDRVMAGLLAACAALLFHPVLKAFTLGQVQVWIDVAFAAACLAWLGGRRFLCGALVGAICLLKPQFSLFLPWALLRRQWRFAGGWAAVVGAGLLLSLSEFGLRNHLDYLAVLRSLSATGEAYWPNQSVNGILNRLLGTAPATTWEPNAFPGYHPLVHLATLGNSLALAAAALLYRRRQAGLLDFQLAALAFTLASPIAWEHHYGILPPILATLYFALRRDGAAARGGLALLAACYLLAGAHLGIAHHAQAGVATLLHSYLFLAAAGVLGLLVRAARRPLEHSG